MANFPSTDITSDHQDYSEIARIADFIAQMASKAERRGLEKEFPPLIRTMIDEVVDTPRTGRLGLAELEKTEKTYLGTKVEILIRDFLGVPKGVRLDLLILDTEVDVKNTVGSNWSIPHEAVGQICILVAIDEQRCLCHFGLLKARSEYLNSGRNQDGKRTVSAEGKHNIWWLLFRTRYPENFWSQFEPSLLRKLHDVANYSANERIAMLFRHYQRKPIPRSAIQDVARQLDSLKRVRKNGGARDLLKREGIAVLSGNYDFPVRHALGFGDMKTGQFVSIRPETEEERRLLAALLD